ncbi:superoxide dismutase [Candidatus Parcubacteria bacterium]|nr:superoxide dismutase [Candidatus Parcubacteria bacterium]
MTYTARTFEIPELKGISQKQVEVHLALYEGYVKHVNLLMETIGNYQKTDDEGGKFAIAEMRRRLGFEFDGMRMHEYYFEQFEGGAQAMDKESALAGLAQEKYGGRAELVTHIKQVAGTRGIGWVVLYHDPAAGTLHTAFVNDHEIGQLAGLPILLALDVWEHAYMVDRVPKEKMSYVDAFFDNLNWGVVEKRALESAP